MRSCDGSGGACVAPFGPKFAARGARFRPNAMGLLDEMCECPYVCVGGCGTRAAFFYGLLEYLQGKDRYDEFHAQLRGAAGTSSGSMVALAILVGANPAAMAESALLLAREHETAAPAMNVHALLDGYGLDEGEVLQHIIDSLLSAMGLSPRTTFAGLRKLTQRTFVVCTTNLHRMEPFYFSPDATPDVPLREAMYMSMCLPFIFKPRRFRGEIHVDGGMTANIPIDAFRDQAPLVLGLSFVRERRIDDVRAFATAVVLCTLAVQTDALTAYRRAQPRRVFLFDTREEAAAAAYTATETFLHVHRKRGFVAAALDEHRQMGTFVGACVLASLHTVDRSD